MKKALLVALLCVGLGLAGCTSSASSGTTGTTGSPAGSTRTTGPSGSVMAAYHSISVQDVKAKLDAGEAVTIVDVRTQSEYADGHLKGAVLIPVDTIADQAAAKLPDQAAVIITYCRSGVRSATAAHTLVNLGYTNIYDMGGLQTWPYPDEIVTN